MAFFEERVLWEMGWDFDYLLMINIHGNKENLNLYGQKHCKYQISVKV